MIKAASTTNTNCITLAIFSCFDLPFDLSQSDPLIPLPLPHPLPLPNDQVRRLRTYPTIDDNVVVCTATALTDLASLLLLLQYQLILWPRNICSYYLSFLLLFSRFLPFPGAETGGSTIYRHISHRDTVSPSSSSFEMHAQPTEIFDGLNTHSFRMSPPRSHRCV